MGYALAVSFGAVLDNPDLIATCLVGGKYIHWIWGKMVLTFVSVDGESETGPTATSWHAYKFIDPAVSGAVLPILHLNGYKISGPTLYGCMR